ncbi:MAG TPA: isochorismatase family protein [Beijerinckiaceae bacterium]
MKDWMKIVPADERKAYEQGGFMTAGEIGERPALVVVDVTMGFCGTPGKTLEEAIQEYGPACGPVSWETMPRIAKLVQLFRDLDRPVVFTRSHPTDTLYSGKATKSKRVSPHLPAGFNDFPEEIAPREDEWVLEKTKASAFFQTPLASYFVREEVDTVVLCGVSTSGCVRASTVDCFSNGFNTVVVDDCCFDRSHFAHCANLFDINAKYGTVVSLEELEKQLLGPQMERASA